MATDLRRMMVSGRVLSCCVALFLTLTPVSAVQRLDSIDDLKKIYFDQSVPKHSLVLLHWFANTVEIGNNNVILLNFDPEEDYGAHHYGNYEDLLDPLPWGYWYYTVGNLYRNTSTPLPSYVVNPPIEEYQGSNLDRIIVRVREQRINRVYLTQHLNHQSEYDPDHTYQITTNLLRQIRRFSLGGNNQRLLDLRNSFGSNTNVLQVINSWGELACLGLFLLIIVQEKSSFNPPNNRPEDNHTQENTTRPESNGTLETYTRSEGSEIPANYNTPENYIRPENYRSGGNGTPENYSRPESNDTHESYTRLEGSGTPESYTSLEGSGTPESYTSLEGSEIAENYDTSENYRSGGNNTPESYTRPESNDDPESYTRLEGSGTPESYTRLEGSDTHKSYSEIPENYNTPENYNSQNHCGNAEASRTSSIGHKGPGVSYTTEPWTDDEESFCIVCSFLTVSIIVFIMIAFLIRTLTSIIGMLTWS